jgi:uncharacterized protein YjbJ (UPF0337 family)
MELDAAEAFSAANIDPFLEDKMIDKDRIVGSAKQIKGSVKQVFGKAIGNTKLQSEGRVDKIKGKIQSAFGGLKDALKGK